MEDKYLLGWTKDPAEASAQIDCPDRSQLLLWHANYHPDGAQLFYPLDGTPFIAALAKPGDDMTPKDWVAFYFDGSVGVCIHPGVWHEAIIPLTDTARFYDKQGKVHGRVGCDFNKEFGVFLSVSLRKPE